MSNLGLYRLTLARAARDPASVHQPLIQLYVPVGQNLVWEADQALTMIRPGLRLEYTPPPITPWAEVERLRTVLEGAARTMQALGQPTIRDNLLGAIGDLKNRQVTECSWCPNGEPLVRHHPNGQTEHLP